MFGYHIFDQDIAVGSRRRDHKGSRFNLIGNNRIGGAVHMLDPADFNHIRTGAAYISAHGIQKVGQVNHVRLFRHIFQNGQPLCADSGQHDINGCANGNAIKINMTARQLLGFGADHAMIDGNIRSQSFKSLNMLINGAHPAEIAPTGHCHRAFGITPQQRTQKIIRSAHVPGNIKRHRRGNNMGSIDFHRCFIAHFNFCAQLLQDLQGDIYIVDVWDILQNTRLFCQ